MSKQPKPRKNHGTPAYCVAMNVTRGNTALAFYLVDKIRRDRRRSDDRKARR